SVNQGIFGIRYSLDTLENLGQRVGILLGTYPMWEMQLGELIVPPSEEQPEERKAKEQKEEEKEKPKKKKEKLPSITELHPSLTIYLKPSTYQALANPEAYEALLSPDTLKVILDPEFRYRVFSIVGATLKSFRIDKIDLLTIYGSDDPVTTGRNYGYYMALRGLLAPVPNLNMQIEPHFDQSVLEWRLKTAFSIHLPITIYIAILRLVLEHSVQALIQKMVIAGQRASDEENQEGSNGQNQGVSKQPGGTNGQPA
ncbi:MAG TPA: DUF2953 domain-containing protein, partial [Methanomicrobiales archaeon]|nr:DUF2953 domain-containing protein [Methanomicrobiales archaeon]